MESLNRKLDQFKIPLALSLVGLVLIIGGIVSSGLLANKPKKSSDFPKESLANPQKIKVDISGAVSNPGVYSLESYSRVEDGVKIAGGFSASASAEYISKSLNLSQKLSDGQKIYIPFEVEPFDFAQVRGVGVVGEIREKIGINNGSQSQLESLPGVGPATATKIMAGRPYQTLEELRTKKAVSKAVFDKIKDLVDLN